MIGINVIPVYAQTSGPGTAVAEESLSAPRLGTWGFDSTAIDPNVKPGDDFNAYANGSWMRRTTIPPDRTSVGLFSNLRYLSNPRVHAILENAAKADVPPNTPEGKLGAMYRAFMDERTVEARGDAPLKVDLDRIRAVRTRDDLTALMGTEWKGFHASVIELDITSDVKHPTRNAVYIDQGGLGLPDRDYYLQPQFASKRLAYEAYINKLLLLCDWPESRMQASVIVAFESKIAAVSWTHADERDHDKTYNPTTIQALQSAAPGFAWSRFMQDADLGHVSNVVVISKTSIPKIAAVYASTPLNTLRAWEAFRTADSATPYLSSSFVNAQFDFRSRVLLGQPELPVRSNRAVAVVNDTLGAAVGKIYVSKYFSPEAKAQVENLVDNLRAALHKRIDELTWMGPATKTEALRKLANLEVPVGYLKAWRDYSGLEIRDKDLYGNVLRGKAFDWRRRVKGLNQPWDKSAWRFWPQFPTAYTENGQLSDTS